MTDLHTIQYIYQCFESWNTISHSGVRLEL